MIENKKGNTFLILIIILILFLYITSTQKVIVNDKQISTATQSTCSLIGKGYDVINKICIENTQYVNKTIS